MSERCATFENLVSIDARLAKAAIPPLTDWWRETLARWYRHPTALSLVARVGRGGCKSHTATKVALTETLLGQWQIPPGERHYFAIVSVNRSEAMQRLRLLEAMLRALGVGFERSGDEIALVDKPLGFKVFACNVGAVSGFRCIGFICDELAKWSADDAAADPAVEVIASLGAMCVTHPNARKLLVSSPLSTVDEHCRRHDMGDTNDQLVAFAPTWVANPSVTEEQTHRIEPDLRVWSREYAAIPSSELSAAFDPADIDAAFGEAPRGEWGAPICVIDPNSGGHDRFTLGLTAWCYPRVVIPDDVTCVESIKYDQQTGRMVRTPRWFRYVPGRCAQKDCFGRVTIPGIEPREDPYIPEEKPPTLCLRSVEAVPSQMGRGDAIVDYIASVCRRMRVNLIVGDQREALMLETAFRARGLRYVSLPWTNANKAEGVRRLRRLMADRALNLAPHDQLRSELHQYSERLTRSGSTTYGARGSGHDDFAALLITAALADNERLIPNSPLNFAGGKHITDGA
ncbi:MAG: hypothetical protein ACM3ZE_31790 [Myxococcales bacterium]